MHVTRSVRVPSARWTARQQLLGPGGQHAECDRLASRGGVRRGGLDRAERFAKTPRGRTSRQAPAPAVAQDARGQARNRELALEQVQNSSQRLWPFPARGAQPNRHALPSSAGSTKRRAGERKPGRRPPTATID